MTRKSFFLGLGIVAVLLGSVLGVLGLLVRHQPAFYGRSELPEGDARQKHARAFYVEVSNLFDGIINKRQWDAAITEEQINSYFAEDFLQANTDVPILPEYIREPRVSFEPDRIRLAFRYGFGAWSTVVSINLRVWLTAKEPNVVALELQGLQAGSLPISAQSLLEAVSEMARQHNVQVTWYRHKGNPVALLRFQPYQYRPTFHLQRLELRDHMIVIGGRSIDAVPHPAAAPAPEVTASALPVEAQN